MLEMLQKWAKGRLREPYLKPPGVPELPLCAWSLPDTGDSGGWGGCMEGVNGFCLQQLEEWFPSFWKLI